MKSAWLLVVTFALTTAADARAAGPSERTVNAWNEYVAATEARMARELASPGGFLLTDFTADRSKARTAIRDGAIPVAKLETTRNEGTTISVPDGTISHWRGAVLVPGITLDTLLDRLKHPSEHGPYQQDVIWMRVRERRGDQLTVAMRLTRQAIVRVTYDTAHHVSYQRLGPARAFSKSVSTRIVEIADAGTSRERALGEGEDRGLLWKMNAYWRFEQHGGGVIVELESLTLSRSIPFGLSGIVSPVVDRVARESMHRTLVSIRSLYARDPRAE